MAPDDQRPTAALHVVVTDEHGRRLRKPALVRWLLSVAPPRARGALCVALVTDAAMRRLNRQFANHDYVTDVLSFPAQPEPAVPPPAFRPPPSRRRAACAELRLAAAFEGPQRNGAHTRAARALGDVVIATGRAERQAVEAGHSLETELRILALHGLLHLLGYDHATDAGRMARFEARLRRKGGLRAGLIERAGSGGRA